MTDTVPGFIEGQMPPMAPAYTMETEPIETHVIARGKAGVIVNQISLPVELGIATLGGIVAGLGSFTGTLTVTTASNWTSVKAGLLGGGFTALVFFTNSLKNWYSQKYGAAI